MYCSNCGHLIPDGASSCPECGQKTNIIDQNLVETSPKVKTKKEFLMLPENNKILRGLRIAGIIAYICAGENFLFGFLNPFLFFISFILLTLGLLIHLRCSRAAAIIMTVYSVIDIVLILLSGELPIISFLLIAGILGIVNTNKAENAWQEYQGDC